MRAKSQWEVTMSRNSFLWLLFVFASLPATASAAPVDVQDKNGNNVRLYDRSRALLIGNSSYTGSWNKLLSVPAEMTQLKEALVSQGFEPEDVTIKSDQRANEVFSAIVSFLSANSGPRTRALVYLSGHGWTDEQGEGFFVGVDSKDVTGPGKEGLISLALIRELHRTSTALHTMIVLDSCYSGALLETRSADPPRMILLDNIKGKAFQLLASGTKVQRVPGESVFLKHFISGIKGAAAVDSGKTFVTFRQLAYWLKEGVSRNSNQTPVFADYPAPGGDMVFVASGPELASATINKPAVNSTPTLTARAAKPAAVVTVAAQQDATAKGRELAVGDFNRRYPKTDVFYYRKAADSVGVVHALNKIGAKYVSRPRQLSDSLVTNGIGCGPSTPVGAIQELALGLLEQGIKIQRISPYGNADAKGGRLELFSTKAVDPKAPALTAEMIRSIKSCSVVMSGRAA
jgi:hypothetical protein